MTPIDEVFPQTTTLPITKAVLAEHQPEYARLPCAIVSDKRVPVLTRWRFSPEELQQILDGGDLVVQMLTFGNGFSPIALSIVQQDENPILVD